MAFDLTGIGSVADAAKTIANKFFPDKMGDGERAKAELELQKILSERDNKLAESKKEIMVAELNQGDNFTKRARPMIIYSGLAFIFLVHVFFPIAYVAFGNEAPELSLPTDFWFAWGGCCSVYTIGRSAEKGGAKNKLVGMITGNK